MVAHWVPLGAVVLLLAILGRRASTGRAGM